jgi:hypothetical protein
MHLDIISPISAKSVILGSALISLAIPPLLLTCNTLTSTPNIYPRSSGFIPSTSAHISSSLHRFSLGIRSSSTIIPLFNRSAFLAPKLIPLNPMQRLKLYMISSSVYSSRLENPAACYRYA